MAAPSPWPATCNAAELAALLDVSARRIRELAQEGVIPRAPGGRYETQASVRGYIATLRTAAKAKPRPDPEVAAAALDGRRERARLAKATADIRETELAQLRGELVAVRPLQVAMATMVTTVRNRILAVPPTARGQLPHLSVDDVETLEDMLAEALTELSRDRRLFGPDADDSDGEADTAEDTDDE